MVVGLVFCVGSVGFGVGEMDEPGPAFFPFLMSICLISFSLIHFTSSLRKGIKGRQFSFVESERFWPESYGVKRIVLIIILLVMFVIAMNYLGFVIASFLFIFLLLRLIEPKNWLTVFIISGLSTGLSYAIFQLWLKADLPIGFLGF